MRGIPDKLVNPILIIIEKEGFTDGEKEKQIRDLWPTFISRDQATAWIREFRKS